VVKRNRNEEKVLDVLTIRRNKVDLKGFRREGRRDWNWR